MKNPWMILAFTALTAGPATGAGINIGWDICGPAGSFGASSSCTSDIGTRSFVVSFVSPRAYSNISLVGCWINFWPRNGGDLPSWWQMAPGACRAGGIDLEFHGLAGAPCDTIPSVLTTWSYEQDPSLNYAQIHAYSGSSGPGIDLVAGREYFVARAIINFTKTAGADSCGGCWVPMLIDVPTVSFTGPEEPTVILDDPDRRQYIYWQPDLVPTRATSWGQIKDLYRGRR